MSTAPGFTLDAINHLLSTAAKRWQLSVRIFTFSPHFLSSAYTLLSHAYFLLSVCKQNVWDNYVSLFTFLLDGEPLKCNTWRSTTLGKSDYAWPKNSSPSTQSLCSECAPCKRKITLGGKFLPAEDLKRSNKLSVVHILQLRYTDSHVEKAGRTGS